MASAWRGPWRGIVGAAGSAPRPGARGRRASPTTRPPRGRGASSARRRPGRGRRARSRPAPPADAWPPAPPGSGLDDQAFVLAEGVDDPPHQDARRVVSLGPLAGCRGDPAPGAADGRLDHGHHGRVAAQPVLLDDDQDGGSSRSLPLPFPRHDELRQILVEDVGRDRRDRGPLLARHQPETVVDLVREVELPPPDLAPGRLTPLPGPGRLGIRGALPPALRLAGVIGVVGRAVPIGGILAIGFRRRRPGHGRPEQARRQRPETRLPFAGHGRGSPL